MTKPLLSAAHCRCHRRRCPRCCRRSSFHRSFCLSCLCCSFCPRGRWIHVPRPCGRRYVTGGGITGGSAAVPSPGYCAATSLRSSALRYAQTALLPVVVGAIGCTFSGIHHRGCPTCKSLRVPTVTSLHASAAAVAAALPLCSIQNVPRIIAPQRPLSDPTDGGGYQDERETP
jgi:hypothetical protein